MFIRLKNLYSGTSIHHLNADKGLGLLHKLLYLLLNLVNNLFPYSNVDDDLVISDFKCNDLEKHWSRLPNKSSPSRKLSDLFWLKLPWDQIRQELNEIHILDIGCGSGNYGSKLIDFSDNNIASYTGYDTSRHNNWAKLEETYSFIQFQRVSSSNILEYIPEGTNFFMTQSAIEHFENDLIFFKQIRDYVLSYRGSVIQIHLFPSSSGLMLYPFHGIRQYTPRTVTKIWKLFRGFSYAFAFRLGGKECNRVHYEFITKPLILQRIGNLRDLRTREYDRKVFKAMGQDMKTPQRSPAFYALLIHSNAINKLF